MLVKAITQLPDRERMMMALYYEQDLNLREIGEIMDVTESRVCQLHTQAIARLRSQVLGELPVAKKRNKEKPRG
jgi:RNA polymerase sigma factor for flagellar operon FliA